MKIMARRKLLYGVLYSAGDVFECGDVEQVRAWVATGAVGLMGAALPERVETQAQGEMAATLEPTSAVSEAELPERIEPPEVELGASGAAPAQEEGAPLAEGPDESPVPMPTRRAPKPKVPGGAAGNDMISLDVRPAL